MLSVSELEELFAYVEDLLEDLSLVSSGSSFGGDNMSHADCRETAADLVDQILLGNISDVRVLTTKRTRDELYARLHEIEDASGSTISWWGSELKDLGYVVAAELGVQIERTSSGKSPA